MLHVQVVALIVAGGSKVTIRAMPLENTSIKEGGKKRTIHQGKMARQRSKKRHQRGKSDDKTKRRTSLFRKLSSRRAEQLGSPLTPSRSLSQLNRSLSSGDSLPGSPTHLRSPRSPPTNRMMWSPASDSAHSTGNSSQSSSPGSTAPNSPASSSHFNRPSSLHGLKHKLQNIKSSNHPNRRKSVHNIPLSPLARTPSPSPMATSPTRSPSPLTMSHAHQHSHGVHSHGPAHSHAPAHHALIPPGISNTTQTYNPGQQQSTPSPAAAALTPRKSMTRPKSTCEPGSPLLRRALSPDRLHPSSAEKQPVTHHQTHHQHRRKGSWHDRKDQFDAL